jgi:hypothetical protein
MGLFPIRRWKYLITNNVVDHDAMILAQVCFAGNVSDVIVYQGRPN